MSGDAGLDISERGMRFSSRWHFAIGTQLAVACSWTHPRLGLRRLPLEGIVVWCNPVTMEGVPGSGSAYETTILFHELPDELMQSLREFSHQLPPQLEVR